MTLTLPAIYGRYARRFVLHFPTVIGALITLAIAWSSLGFGARGLEVPIMYSGDGLSHGLLLQNVRETGWYLNAPRLGFPFEATFHDYPISENTNVVLIRIIDAFTDGYSVTMNVFYLLSFAMAGAFATAVLRRLRVTAWLAVVGGVLFALLPYHYMRAAHLLLTTYWVVPVFVWCAMRGYESDSMPRGRWGAILVLLFLAGGSGIYYAFFGCFLMVIGACVAVSRGHARRAARAAALFVGATCLGVAVSLAPHAAYVVEHGANPAVGKRGAFESELLGLKPIQLVLPTPGHRIDRFEEISNLYAESSPNTNENRTASLGLAGAVGLALSLCALLFARRRYSRLVDAARLNFAAIAFGTIGGAGAVFAYAISPGIRAGNRISVFIGFLSLFALLLCWQHAVARHVSGPATRRLAIRVSAAALLALGALDQIPEVGRPGVGTLEPFNADKAFFTKLEQTLPPGATVLQLPYVGYPEQPAVVNYGAYEHLIPYLHTRALRFSFGVMLGRPGEQWLRTMAMLEPGRLVDAAALAGFDAIYVAGRGYADGGAKMVAGLEAELGAPVLGERDVTIFRVPDSRRNTATPHVAISGGSGFYGWGSFLPGELGSWASGDAELHIESPTALAQQRIQFRLHTIAPRSVSIYDGDALLHAVTLAAGSAQDVALTVGVPRGRLTLKVATDRAAELPGNGDPRLITFGVGVSVPAG